MGGEPHFLAKVDGDIIFHRKSFTELTSPGPINVYASALGLALKQRSYSGRSLILYDFRIMKLQNKGSSMTPTK